MGGKWETRSRGELCAWVESLVMRVLGVVKDFPESGCLFFRTVLNFRIGEQLFFNKT